MYSKICLQKKKNFIIFCYEKDNNTKTLQFDKKTINDINLKKNSDNTMVKKEVKIGDNGFNIDYEKGYNFYIVAENEFGFSSPSNEITILISKNNDIQLEDINDNTIFNNSQFKNLNKMIKTDCKENIKDKQIIGSNFLNKFINKELDIKLK